MEENKEKELDALLKKTVKEAGLEQPSMDFTATVLSKISETAPTTARVYRPLISKGAWLLLLLAVLGVFAYSLLGNGDLSFMGLSDVRWSEHLNFDFLEQWTQWKISNIFVYGTLGLTLFVCLQVVLLKRHLDNRYVLE
ncbi:hypothetical protein [Spongiimicrobium sp. 2-473A-2-J]|uniref:hypothetical protein n=1 Tax=Eudoraea algarum TaxID=3417568 RepID=UPI003D369D0A